MAQLFIGKVLRVKVHIFRSYILTSPSEVPQGSYLGPTLFCLLKNDIVNIY